MAVFFLASESVLAGTATIAVMGNTMRVIKRVVESGRFIANLRFSVHLNLEKKRDMVGDYFFNNILNFDTLMEPNTKIANRLAEARLNWS
jgi:hypothetical protein